MKSYKLRYLPLFFDDLAEITSYIADHLQNPKAPENLLDEVEKAIQERLYMPASFEPFHFKKPRAETYYRIYVKNYTVFYVVIDDVMEVRRILYSARNFEKLL